MDYARSVQSVCEEIVLRMARTAHRETGQRTLCVAGGVALNAVANGRLRREGPFESVWIQPAAGDAGGALGAAMLAWHRWLRQPRVPATPDGMRGARLGPVFEPDDVERELAAIGARYTRLDDASLDDRVAQLLDDGAVVGWFEGAMEFGPRALGARSILASPIDPAMQGRLNDLKDREDFRPVAPAVVEEEASEWFAGARVAPYMLFVFDVRPERADRIPAVRHVDGTARVQTVRRDQNPRYYDLLRAFQARTGVPVLVNTSFNTRGEPIVCTPRDAVESFWTSPLDALAIGSFLVEKPAVAAAPTT
jgi:carbamoyltransferase